MDLATGHFLVILLSVTLLIEEGVSDPRQEKGEDDLEVMSGERQLQGGMYEPPGFPAIEYPVPQYAPQPGAMKHSIGERARAHGEIRLDLSDMFDELRMPEVIVKMSKIEDKIDEMYRVLMSQIQNNMGRDTFSVIKSMGAQVDYLTRAMPALLSGMQSMNEQLEAQQRVIQHSVNNRCDSRGFEQVVQMMRGDLAAVAEEVKQLRVDQSTGMKLVYEVVTRNGQVLASLQQGLALTANACSACSSLSAPHSSPYSATTSGVTYELINQVHRLPRDLLNGLQKMLTTHELLEKQQRAEENDSIVRYLTDFATKMVDYRDEYLQKLVEQNRKMEVIQKTVTQTTQVLKKAANGAQDALQASRALLENTKCGKK